MNQTYTNLEIILVDDGSPDNCPAICDEWADKDDRIRVIHKENGGLSSARNAGLDIARGELIGFVDSDDFILPEMYESLYRLIDENDADLSMCEYLRVDENGLPIEDETYDEDDKSVNVLTGKGTLEELLKNWHYVLAWNKLYRSHIFRNIRYPIGKIHEDEFTAHHILGECEKTAATNRKFYMYTIRNDSIMSNLRKSFDVRHMDDAYLAYMDRYYFLRNVGMNDLAESVLASTEVFIKKMLREGSYIKHFMKFNRAIISVSIECLRSRGIKMKLRPVRLMLEVLINILRDIIP